MQDGRLLGVGNGRCRDLFNRREDIVSQSMRSSGSQIWRCVGDILVA